MKGLLYAIVLAYFGTFFHCIICVCIFDVQNKHMVGYNFVLFKKKKCWLLEFRNIRIYSNILYI